MDFGFDHAAKLYRDGTHPRVLLGPGDVERLRKRVRSGAGRIILDSLRRKVDPWVAKVLDCQDLPAAIGDNRFAMAFGFSKPVYLLDNVAMVGLLDGRGDPIEAVRRFLLALPAAEAVNPTGFFNRLSYSLTLNVPLGYDLIASRVPLEDLRPYAEWAAERCVRLTLAEESPAYYRHPAGNITVSSVCGLALMSALALQGDPGVPDLWPALKDMAGFLDATLNTALGPQGYPVEDIGYGTGVMAIMAYSVEAMRRAGLYDAYASCERYRRFGQAALHFVQPWGSYLCNTGDASAAFSNRGFVLARLAAETKDPTLLWLLATLGHPGAPGLTHDQTFVEDVAVSKSMTVPAEWFSLLVLDDLQPPVPPARAGVPTAFQDDTRGIVSFRGGWKPEDMLLVFDGGQYSYATRGHQHASGGHFGLSALGEYFAIDTGRYGNEQDQHNVVLVDGQNGRPRPGEWKWHMSHHHADLIDYVPGECCDFAAVDSSHLHDAYWARRGVGLVKGRGLEPFAWTVDDINKDDDRHTYWWTLNTHYNNSIKTGAASAAIRGCLHGQALDVYWVALPPPGQFRVQNLTVTQDIGKCGSHRNVEDLHGSVAKYKDEKGYYPPENPVRVRPRLIAQFPDCVVGRFMAVMIPRRKGTKPAQVKRLSCVDNSLAVQVIFPGSVDTLIYAFDHGLLEAGDIRGRGQWCVVRRSPKTGRVLAVQLGHGESLSVAGKKLRG